MRRNTNRENLVIGESIQTKEAGVLMRFGDNSSLDTPKQQRRKRASRWPETRETNPALLDAIPVPDAADLWGITRSAINKACSTNNFPPGEFIRVKNGYLITRTGMLMVYGKPIKKGRGV